MIKCLHVKLFKIRVQFQMHKFVEEKGFFPTLTRSSFSFDNKVSRKKIFLIFFLLFL